MEAPTAQAVSSERSAFFDNIKGLLMILVVAGHVMLPVQNDHAVLSTVFDCIYTFHMPLFIFVSGLFAKGAWRDGRLNVNRIISFVVLGLIFQVAYRVTSGLALPGHLLMFNSAPWYLIAMAWWYLTAPVLSRLGAPVGMAASLIAALVSGCCDLSDGFLALGRTLSFLPCFAAGYYATTEQVERVATSPWLWICVSAGAAIICTRIANPDAFSWFMRMTYGDNPYLAGQLLPGMAQKLVALGVATVLSLGLLRIIPRDQGILTVLGARTLQVYVLHRIIRGVLKFCTPFYQLPLLADSLTGTAVVLAVTAVLTAICALPVFTAPFCALMRRQWIQPRGPRPAKQPEAVDESD